MFNGIETNKRIRHRTLARLALRPWERLLLLLAVFIISATTLMFEIVLTRLFSIIFSYHYVFMTVSLAILGLGLGAFLIFKSKFRFRQPFMVLALLYSLSLLACLVLLVYLPIANLFIYISLAIFPFMFAGAMLALIFDRFSARSGAIYGADLSGASLGCLLVILALERWGGISAGILLAAAALLAMLFFSIIFRKKLWAAVSIAAILAASPLFFYNLNFSVLDRAMFRKSFTRYGPTKFMFRALQDGAKVVYSRWGAFSRTDVVANPNNPAELLIFTDGGAVTKMVQFKGDLSDVSYLKREVGFFPFYFGDNRKVLIIGSGGGRDVLMAMLGGAQKITAVEINPGTVAAVERFSSYGGDIYNYNNVKLLVDEGRSFIRRSREKYDVIYLSMVYTDVAEVQGYSLVENYVHTKQAFAEYLDHVGENGQVVFMFHDFADLSKAFVTAIDVLRQEGKTKEQALKHVMAINSSFKGPQSIFMPMLIIKKSPFTRSEAETRAQTALYYKFRPIFIPYFYETLGPYALLANPSVTLEKYIKQIKFNVRPATDNNPFFYNMNKGLPAHLKNLLIVSLSLIAVFLAPYFYSLRKDRRGLKLPLYFSYYFASLGLGFMLVEIPLIQKFILFLGYPVLTFSVTLFSILLFAGLGSLAAARIKALKISWLVLLIGALIFIYILALPRVFDGFLTYSILIRSLIAMFTLAPLSFFLGMPFPAGIEILKKTLSFEVPWMWGINAVTSVLGSILAIILAMKFGFNLTMGTAALIYLALFFVPKPHEVEKGGE